MGIDGSPESRAALLWGFDEARLRGTFVAVVHAWRYPAVELARFGGSTLPVVTSNDLEPVSNTRRDGEEFLSIAARIGIRVRTAAYPLDAADAALQDLAHDRITGAAVLRATWRRRGV